MNRNINAWAAAFLAASLWLSGCASTKPKKPAEDSTVPFAEQTVAMLGDLQFGMQRANIVLLRSYIDDGNSPRVEEYRSAWDEATLLLRAIVAYSIQVVDLVDTSNGEGAVALADYIDNMVDIIETQPRASAYMAGFDFNAITSDVRSRPSLAEGLEASQPAIEKIVSVTSQLLIRVRDDVELAAEEINGEILTEHRAVLEYQTYLRRRQGEIIAQLRELDRARAGDEAALASLAAAGNNNADMVKAESYLIDRLGSLDTIRARLQPDFQLFQEQQTELRAVKDVAYDGLRRAQISVVLWSRAHREFATGETSQFGVTELTSALLKYAL